MTNEQWWDITRGEHRPQKPFEVAYKNWRKAADKGYGDRDHSIAHMNKVDARIHQLKSRYEELLAVEKGVK